MEKIAVIGAGLIGRAWSIVFARSGFAVALHDPVAGATDRCLAALDGNLADLVKAGLIDDPAAVRARVTAATSLAAALDGAVYMQENAPEDLETKRRLYVELDRLAPADAVLASSTSAIPASQFTETLKGRARCLVAHPVNPPYLVPLVELCGAPWTSPEALARAETIQRRAGQVPIIVKREVPGFILNRLQGALLNEALRLVDEGYVSPDHLDNTVRHGLGLRWSFMGPFETIDLNAPDGVADYARRYGPFYRRLAIERGGDAPWDGQVVTEIEAARRRHQAADALGQRSIWRDRRLMALIAHKRDMDKRD
jgi:3-hydroxyacyl-CoA dehydrogenase